MFARGIYLALLLALPAHAAACPKLNRAGLMQLLKTRKHAKVVFFASWCESCRPHLQASDPKHDLAIALYDDPKPASRALRSLNVQTPCYTDDGIAKSLQIESLPAAFAWQDGVLNAQE